MAHKNAILVIATMYRFTIDPDAPFERVGTESVELWKFQNHDTPFLCAVPAYQYHERSHANAWLTKMRYS